MNSFTISFIYEGVTIQILGSERETMRDMVQKFCTKAKIDKKELYCVYSGKKLDELDESKTLGNLFKDKKNQIINILAYSSKDTNKESTDHLIKPSQIVCPGCKDIALIKLDNYKISINCKRNHNIKNIFLKNFEKSQRIDESKIICNKCEQRNKNKSYNKEFFTCTNCNKNLCPLCMPAHKRENKEHTIINYDQKNYICFEHGVNFSSYCKVCKQNLCSACENQHSDHDVISLGKLFPKQNELTNKMDEFDNNFNELKSQIKYIIGILNNFIENLEVFYSINTDINDSFNNKYINYEILNNIKEINNSEISEDISKIINTEDINKKFEMIFEIQVKMNSKDENKIVKENIESISKDNKENIESKSKKNDDKINIDKIDINKKIIIYNNQLSPNNYEPKLNINNESCNSNIIFNNNPVADLINNKSALDNQDNINFNQNINQNNLISNFVNTESVLKFNQNIIGNKIVPNSTNNNYLSSNNNNFNQNTMNNNICQLNNMNNNFNQNMMNNNISQQNNMNNAFNQNINNNNNSAQNNMCNVFNLNINNNNIPIANNMNNVFNQNINNNNKISAQNNMFNVFNPNINNNNIFSSQNNMDYYLNPNLNNNNFALANNNINNNNFNNENMMNNNNFNNENMMNSNNNLNENMMNNNNFNNENMKNLNIMINKNNFPINNFNNIFLSNGNSIGNKNEIFNRNFKVLNEEINRNLYSIVFISSFGKYTTIVVEDSLTVKQLLKKYIETINRPYLLENEENKLIFIYNGNKINYNDDRTIKNLFYIHNNYKIVVGDSHNIIESPEKNICFEIEKGKQMNFLFCEALTIKSLLKYYFIKIGKENLIENKNITFLFQGNKIKPKDLKTEVGIYFKNIENPKVIVKDPKQLI